MASKKAADVAEEAAPAPVACVAYTGGWSGDLTVPGVPSTDQHQIDAAVAAGLVDSGAYRALPADCTHEAVAQPDDEVSA
jgi:hypothetical protein